MRVMQAGNEVDRRLDDKPVLESPRHAHIDRMVKAQEKLRPRESIAARDRGGEHVQLKQQRNATTHGLGQAKRTTFALEAGLQQDHGLLHRLSRPHREVAGRRLGGEYFVRRVLAIAVKQGEPLTQLSTGNAVVKGQANRHLSFPGKVYLLNLHQVQGTGIKLKSIGPGVIVSCHAVESLAQQENECGMCRQTLGRMEAQGLWAKEPGLSGDPLHALEGLRSRLSRIPDGDFKKPGRPGRGDLAVIENVPAEHDVR